MSDLAAGGPSDTATVAKTRPTRDELAAWRAFLRAHAVLTRALEAELLAEQDLSLAAYDVLVQLAEAPERRLRMTELAELVLLSRSGVTRLVDRMEKSGLVSRCPVESDGRGVAAQREVDLPQPSVGGAGLAVPEQIGRDDAVVRRQCIHLGVPGAVIRDETVH